MKPELKKKLKIYLKQVKILLPFYGKEEKIFIRNLRQNIEEYIGSYPDSTWKDIVEEFETPQEVVLGYVSTLEPELLHKRLKFKKYLIIILSIILILAFIYFGFIISTAYDVYQTAQDEIITHEVTVIE